MQMLTLRGIPEDRLKAPTNKAGKQKEMPAYRYNTVNEMLTFYSSCTTFGTATNVTNISKGLTLKKPYPNYFDPSVGVNGNITAVPRKPGECKWVKISQNFFFYYHCGIFSCAEYSSFIWIAFVYRDR